MSGRDDRIRKLFLEARTLGSDRQRKFLDDACVADAPEVRCEIEELLAHDRRPDGFLGEAWTDDCRQGTQTAPTAVDQAVLERIGPYKPIGLIGRGGMGEVWMAEQERPIRRRVALKLIKSGMDTRQVIARFEAERQALALMDHPCVAKVFEAGETPRGRPYFAMEYVQGIPITEHCDRQRLTTRERLELFVQVCDGIQHAHQKAIIHRDLKPSNVLVSYADGQATPKIIDFGVAKATAQRLTEQTLFTETGVLIGTPEYMSPEQAEMTHQSLDTRTDVYSLGVMLYELMVGARPFDGKEMREAGFDEMRRKIREEEPSKPSERLSTLGGERSEESAKRRRTDVSTLRRELKGDLDWITMRAMEKERTRRYASASEMAADIGRHLRHEPVLAGPPSTAYRLGKFVRRHRVGVAAGSVVIIALVAGILGISMGLVRARASERSALQEAETATQVSRFLVDLFRAPDPKGAQGSGLTTRELLDQAAAKLSNELGDQPVVRARLMTTIGSVYTNLGLYDEARPLLEEALHTQRRVLEPNDTDLGYTLHEMGYLLEELSEPSRGHYEDALRILESRLGPNHPDVAWVLNNLANGYRMGREFDTAQRLYQRSIDIHERAGDPRITWSLNDYALLLKDRGDHELARAVHERALRLREKYYGADSYEVAMSAYNLGEVLEILGEYDEARGFHDRALAIWENVLDPEHPYVAFGLRAVARSVAREGDPEKALALHERALTILETTYGPDDWNVGWELSGIGELLLSTEEYEEAQSRFERAVAIFELVEGPRGAGVADGLFGLARICARRGDRRMALEFLRRAVDRGLATERIADDPSVSVLQGALEFQAILAGGDEQVEGE